MSVVLLRDLPTHHFFRRQARRKKAAYEKAFPDREFVVVPAKRGPFRYRVEEVIKAVSPSTG